MIIISIESRLRVVARQLDDTNYLCSRKKIRRRHLTSVPVAVVGVVEFYRETQLILYYIKVDAKIETLEQKFDCLSFVTHIIESLDFVRQVA